MKLKIGDKVSLIDDDLKGIIINIKSNTAIVEDIKTGFEYKYPLHKLVKNLPIRDLVSHTPSFNKEEYLHKNNPSVSKTLEVDLHIESLLKRSNQLLPHEILNYQLNVAKEKIGLLINKKINKLILIHGIGKGILKQELIKLIKQHETLHYHSASFRYYGCGAIEVFY